MARAVPLPWRDEWRNKTGVSAGLERHLDVAVSAIRVVPDIHSQWSVELHPIAEDPPFESGAFGCSAADFSANRILD